MRGDKIEAVIEVGGGQTRTWVMEATRNGREVRVEIVRSETHLIEVGHTGKTVRTWRFRSDRVVALVEVPATEAESQPPAGTGDPAQPSLLD